MSSKYPKFPSFKNVEPTDVIHKVSAHLVVFPDPMHAYQSGSSCRIARSLYLTAAHVVTDWMNKFGNSAEIWAVHSEAGPRYSIWTVDCAWLSPVSDLALLHAKPYNDTAANETVWPSSALSLIPPALGERVVGFGHHSPDQSITVDDAGTRHIVVNSPGAATVGEVREIHQERRDPVRLNFPCFQVNARFDGGMSGGPVFNEAGQACGVICSNLPPEDEKQEHVSYATTLWPLMGIGLTVAPDGRECPSYPLIELAQKGIIHAIGRERVRVTPVSDNGLYRVEFSVRS